MNKDNYSMTTEFTLTGFTDRPELQPILFIVFFAVYLITMVGNLGLVVLIYMERRLHTTMYIFLCNLALMDFCCSSTVTPKMLENFFSEDRIISLYGCMAQFYFFCFAETADLILLASMAYDRYAAICSPLQYHTKMSKKLCVQMNAWTYLAGNVHSMIHIGLLFRLTFCSSHEISHFFCDVFPLFRLSCADPFINELIIHIFTGSFLSFTLAIVLISYFYILFTIFKMKSKEGRGKALSTCASHFISVSILYVSLLFVYVQPSSSKEEDKDIPVAVFYTQVIPLLNPFIYSLRNKEVINAVKRIMKNKSQNILKQIPVPATN
ncbi:olfactory receptor 5K3-like [Choloepus didactylus]|uniref:olfactory receptor 5K3-like n=1 Tax=Choloepus didactylus TaxID=27675 RepID=UPI00189C61F9|nr:olfactory receptor 5K3-like [Choloepus didactylus]